MMQVHIVNINDLIREVQVGSGRATLSKHIDHYTSLKDLLQSPQGSSTQPSRRLTSPSIPISSTHHPQIHKHLRICVIFSNCWPSRSLLPFLRLPSTCELPWSTISPLEKLQNKVIHHHPGGLASPPAARGPAFQQAPSKSKGGPNDFCKVT